MKIAIMSDAHDNWTNLSNAIQIANKESCNVLLFVGDLIAPPGIKVVENFQGQVHVIWGNNEAEKLGIHTLVQNTKNITLHGDIFEQRIDNICIFMNHYPRIAELAAHSGMFDLCIHGHTHEFRQESIKNTLLINPGEIQGYKTGKASFIIFDTNTKQVTRIDL